MPKLKVTLKTKIKHRIQTLIIDNINKCNANKLSQKHIGIIIRSMHMCAPMYFFTILLFAPQIVCVLIMIILLFVAIMFCTFSCCVLTVIEKKLCNDNFTIIDPLLELLNLEINHSNGLYVTHIIGVTYMTLITIIYYCRFVK